MQLPRVALLGLLGVACSAPPLRWPDAPVSDPEPSGPAYLQAYKDSYYRALGTRIVGHVSRAELVAELRTARVLWLGDHHQDEEHHAQMLALLAHLQHEGLRLRLGLEAIGIEDEVAVHELVAGRMGMPELRERVRRRWSGSWLEDHEVDGAFYRQVLSWAAVTRTPVFGLESVPRAALYDRDALIAERVRELVGRHAEDLIVVVVGHAHLLGEGRLIERVGRRHVAIGARMSLALQRDAAQKARPAGSLLRSESGVLFFPQAVAPESG